MHSKPGLKMRSYFQRGKISADAVMLPAGSGGKTSNVSVYPTIIHTEQIYLKSIT